MRKIPGEYGAGKKRDADGAAGKGRAGKGRDYSGKPTGKTGRYSDKDKPGSPASSGPGAIRGKRPYEKRDDAAKTPSFRPKADSDERTSRPWKQDRERSGPRSADTRNPENTGDRPWSKGKPSFRKDEAGDKPRSFGDSPRKSRFPEKSESETRPYRKRAENEEKPTGNFSRERNDSAGDDDRSGKAVKRTRTTPYKGDESADNQRSGGTGRFDKPDHSRRSDEAGDRRPYKKREPGASGPGRFDKPDHSRRSDEAGDVPARKRFSGDSDSDSKPYKKREPGTSGPERKSAGSRDKFREGSPAGENRYKGRKTDGKKPSGGFTPKIKEAFKSDGTIRLNKYIANSGVCSRREADTLIESGVVSVNGIIVTELGTRITRNDKVQFGGETLSIEKKVYLLLNKPKGYITTVDDPQERNTVMMLIKDACRERVYPVGRLDRNTSGLLLFTNDGDIAKKLTHPGHKVRKVYHVELNKALSKGDMLRLSEGVELEDGLMAVDEIAYTGSENSKKNVGVVVHSGKNRVVRRLFEALEYDVVKLDRVAFANLTKKDLPRGRWRMLDEKEISLLQMI